MDSFSDLVRQRRSHRRFTDVPVDERDLQTILRAALMAPTGHGSRKWQFVLVRDPLTLQDLSRVRPAGSAFLSGAGAAVVVLGEPAAQSTRVEDGAIAAVTMQYQAEALGLGSCWCQIRGREGVEEGQSAEQLVRDRLGIPASLSVLCIVGIGHPADERKAQDESSLKWEQVHSERFQDA